MDVNNRFLFPVVATKPGWHHIVPSILHDPCLPVAMDDPRVLDVLPDVLFEMFRTLYSQGGVGLAAPQIGIRWRLAVVDTLYKNLPEGRRLVLLNPEWLPVESGTLEAGRETCLSLPNIEADILRQPQIRLKNRTLANQEEEIAAAGFLARVIQHEVDHLDGRLYLDRIETPDEVRAAIGGLDMERACTALQSVQATELLAARRQEVQTP